MAVVSSWERYIVTGRVLREADSETELRTQRFIMESHSHARNCLRRGPVLFLVTDLSGIWRQQIQRSKEDSMVLSPSIASVTTEVATLFICLSVQIQGSKTHRGSLTSNG